MVEGVSRAIYFEPTAAGTLLIHDQRTLIYFGGTGRGPAGSLWLSSTPRCRS